MSIEHGCHKCGMQFWTGEESGGQPMVCQECCGALTVMAGAALGAPGAELPPVGHASVPGPRATPASPGSGSVNRGHAEPAGERRTVGPAPDRRPADAEAPAERIPLHYHVLSVLACATGLVGLAGFVAALAYAATLLGSPEKASTAGVAVLGGLLFLLACGSAAAPMFLVVDFAKTMREHADLTRKIYEHLAEGRPLEEHPSRR